MCVCVYVCMYVRTYVCMFVYLYICLSVCLYVLEFNMFQCVAACFRASCFSCSMLEQYGTICYGVATISRLLKIIGLFCKRAL